MGSDKLGVMRRRIGIAWAIAGSAGLALLVLLACHPGYAAAAPAGMSAPVAPVAAMESARTAQLLPSQWEWQGVALQGTGFVPTPAAVCAVCDARREAEARRPHYGPMNRRPPPSFS